MQKKISPTELELGMYVILPVAWHEHDFLKNQFLIDSEKQIKKIRELGLKTVTIDTAKGRDVKEPVNPGTKNKGEEIISPALLEAITDKSLEVREKATVVHKETVELMKRLLANPSASNIGEAKKAIHELVNLILTDDDVTDQLLKITSYDHYTYTHSVSVGFLGIALAKVLFKGSMAHNMHELGAAFFLHDIGKVRIPTDILNKPVRLTEEELKVMKQHPRLGFIVLSETKHLTLECRYIVLQHHERYDGTGYPKGLKGEDIHLYARICSMADVYDALTSVRPYRNPLTPFAALELMKKEMLHHFQRELFEQFVLLLGTPR